MKKWMKRSIPILMIAFFVMANGSVTAFAAKAAQEDTVSEDTASANAVDMTSVSANYQELTNEEIIAKVLDSNPEDAGEPNTVKPEVPQTTYTKDVNYTSTTLQGIFTNSELYFQIPKYWETKYVYAEIQYDVSRLIQSVASSLTFSINNVPIDSCRIMYKNGETQVAYVRIPMELVKENDYNVFTISAYARLYDEEGCIDDFSGANWLEISDVSYIRCGYEVKDPGHRISYYPYPFISTLNERGEGLSIAVSNQASDGEVAAAMNMMANLSTSTTDENQINFCLLSDLAATKPKQTVVVANYKSLTAEYKSMVKDTAKLDKNGIVVFGDDAAGNPLLLITSNDDDCLLEAAYMLMDADRVAQEKTDTAIIPKGSADIAVNSTTLSQMVAGNYTVGDIVGSGLSFVGPFHNEQLIYLPFTEDYFLSDAGKVTLKFRYSDNLDFDRSLMTVYWGDIPVASKKLTKENAGGDELTFTMPADVVGTSAGAIKISFDLEIKDLICTPRQEQMPWAYISEESVLYLPASTGIVLTFDLKPSPFRTDGKFNDLMLVIPDSPTSEDLNLYAQIIGMYGEGVEPYGTFYVRRTSEFSKDDADYNIITTGTYKDNSLIQSLNENLHFAYENKGARFASNEHLILSDTYAGNIAIMQLLESPFATNRGVLAVTGIDDDTLNTITSFMRSSKQRLSLAKDCVLIDSEYETKSYQFISSITQNEEPTLAETLVSNKQSLIFTIVATSVMLMLLIAVILVLIRIKMYRRTKDEE